MEAKRFLKLFFSVACVALGITMVMNYLHDDTGILNADFSCYRCEPTQSYVKMRHLLQHYESYDALLFGTSRVGNIDLTKLKNGLRYYNMSQSESVPQEWLAELRLLLANGARLKEVALGLDDISFYVDPAAHTRQLGRIPYKTEGQSFETWASLWLRKPSASSYKREATEASFYEVNTTGQVRHPYQDTRIEKNREAHMHDAKFQFAKRYETNNQQAALTALREIKKLCDEYNIRLIVFFNPLHKTAFLATKQEKWKEWKERVAQITSFYDFAWINATTSNNYNYYETSHFRPLIGDKIMEVIWQGKQDVYFCRYVERCISNN